MFSALLYLIPGSALLYLGGEGIVAGSSRLALRLRITPLAVGLTVVAFGTSSPELAVTLDAALEQVDDVALGNIVGSNICNIALILGLSALVRPIRVDPRVVRGDLPIMIGCSLLLIALLADRRLGRIDGAIFTAGIIVYTVSRIVLARREHRSRRAELPEVVPRILFSVAPAAALVAAAVAALALGSRLFVEGAIQLAASIGFNPAVIALTVVALGTSLPELVTSVLASLRGNGDIAVGNVVGSNIFNILAILGITTLVRPLPLGGLVWHDLATLVGVAVLALPLLATGLRLTRSEGVALLACYAAYVGWRTSS